MMAVTEVLVCDGCGKPATTRKPVESYGYVGPELPGSQESFDAHELPLCYRRAVQKVEVSDEVLAKREAARAKAAKK